MTGLTLIERIEVVWDMYGRFPTADIAQAMDLTVQDVMDIGERTIAKPQTAKRRDELVAVTDVSEDTEAIIELYTEGWTLREIAKAYGKRREAINALLIRQGVKVERRGRKPNCQKR